MCNVKAMIHMDEDYMWRWYIIDALGKSSCISAQSFFDFEDARRDYDAAQERIMAPIA